MAGALGAPAKVEKPMRYITTIEEREYLVEILDDGRVTVDGQVFQVDFAAVGEQAIFSLLLDGESFEAYVYPAGSAWQVLYQGRSFEALVEEEMEKKMRLASASKISQTAEYYLKAPMPGLVVSVPVEDGQAVRKGDVLVVLESMKMQNELKTPRDGQVTRLRVKPGDQVEQHQNLLTLV